MYLFSCYIWLFLMFMGYCPLMVLWFLIKLVAVLRPSLHGGFRFSQCVSIFVVDDFGLRPSFSSDFFNHFDNFLWVLVRLFHMLTPLFEIISLVCICRLPKLLVEPCPTLQVSSDSVDVDLVNSCSGVHSSSAYCNSGVNRVLISILKASGMFCMSYIVTFSLSVVVCSLMFVVANSSW